MKAKIAAGSEPWLTSYNTLIANGSSSASKTFNPPAPIIGRNAASAFAATRYPAEADAVTAYQNALVFVLTGQTAHADETVKILNAYARGTQHFDAVDPERDLEAAILGWLRVSSAELVRYSGNAYTGWQPADITTFNDWIRNVVYSDTAYNPTGVLVTPLPNGAGRAAPSVCARRSRSASIWTTRRSTARRSTISSTGRATARPNTT